MARKKDTKKEFIVREEKGKKNHVRPMIDGKVIETPIKENIEIMSLDNKPISNEVVKEPTNIPDKFVNVKPQKPISSNNTIKVRNGRVYKDLGNGIGMYADNGKTFQI